MNNGINLCQNISENLVCQQQQPDMAVGKVGNQLGIVYF